MAKKPMRRTWGSPRETSPGIWELRYPYTRPDGNRYQKSETFRGTRPQAEAHLSALHVKYVGADSGTEITLSEYWKGWFLKGLKSPVYAPMTVQSYKSLWKNHVEPAFGHRIMTSITPREVQDWLDTMTPGVAAHAKTLMQSLYGAASGLDRLIESNVMRAVRYRISTAHETQTRAVDKSVLSRSTAEAILEACKGEFWEPTFILSCFGGCRREEAVGCRPAEDIWTIETEAGTFVIYDIKRGVQRVGGKVIIADQLKTDASSRSTIIMPPYSNRFLELIKDNDGWLIGNGTGGPVDPEIMAKAWRRWFQKQPFVGIPWKNLRNSYVTMMHEDGVDIETLAKLCGHTTTLVTSKHYDRPDAAALVRTLGNVLKG